jgi:hypothetical protein
MVSSFLKTHKQRNKPDSAAGGAEEKKDENQLVDDDDRVSLLEEGEVGDDAA